VRPNRRAVRLVAVVLLVAFVLPVGWVVSVQYVGPDDGTVLDPELSAAPGKQWTSSLPVERARSSPLRPDDVVIAVNGRPVGRLGDPSRNVGDVVTYTIVRDGRRRSVRVPLRRFDVVAGLRENVDVFVLPLVLFIVSAFVFAVRPYERSARVMLAVAVFLTAGTAAWPLGFES
jgi:hypothetical protein